MSRQTDYQRYLESDHWRELRKQVFALSGWRCEFCGSGERLQGHHLNYRDWISCTPEDVMALCKVHHDRWHQSFSSTAIKTREEVLVFLKNPTARKLKRRKPRGKGVRGGALQRLLRNDPVFMRMVMTMDYETFKRARMNYCPKGVPKHSYRHNSVFVYRAVHGV